MASQTHTTRTTTSATFTRAEWLNLCALRNRYQQDHDLFSAPEQARLRFLRWLYQTGRLVP